MKRVSLLLGLGLLLLVPSAWAQQFIGTVLLVPYNFEPNGYAFCDGQLLSISQNTALFSLLGTTYGGDGQSTFALPDLRGRVPVGQGQGPGLSARTVGDRGGEEQVTLTVSQLPAHSHAAIAQFAQANAPSPAGHYWSSRAGARLYSTTAPNVQMSTQTLGSSGGDQHGITQPHENLKPFLTLNYVISLFGIFPSQN